MKTGLLLSTVATLVCWAAPAAAQTATGFSIGVEVLDYNYRERETGPTEVFDDGAMVGLDFGYTARIGNGLFFSARVAGRTGDIDYRSDDGERLDDVEQSVGQLDLRLVKDMPLSPRAVLSPFVGIGHRLLLDKSGGESTASGAQGYDREVSYLYLPVGATLSFGESARSNIAFSGEYDFVIGSRFESDLKDIDASLPDLKLDGRGGHGIQLAATLTRPIGTRHALSIGPFLRHWRLDRSDGTTVRVQGTTIEFHEPRNRTTEWGARVGFKF